MFECPWSSNSLKNLSRHIRDGTEPPANLPSYSDIILWYNDVAIEVQRQISALDWVPLLGDRSFEVTSRPKTIDTLRQKLMRDPGTPLPSVQDVAGVRFEAEMSLNEQDAVAGAIAGLYDHGPDDIKDLRRGPHSGYRAVHVWLRLPARVEVQIRTHLQGAWANAYEAAADTMGRDIRYGTLPVDDAERELVKALQSLSTGTLAQFETMRNDKERELLRLREAASRETPLYDRQVESRLQEEWDVQRSYELRFIEQLRDIHDRFRAMRRRVS